MAAILDEMLDSCRQMQEEQSNCLPVPFSSFDLLNSLFKTGPFTPAQRRGPDR